ncbi:MAG: arylsulfatase [Opitutaceae bacterium]|nr:arylsulfatase [Opitutaceae bacterium]
MLLRILPIFLYLLSPYLEAAAKKPNIILIFVDDLGYGDLACYGNEKIKTPNIDQLASEGQRWTSFYASGPACVASRTGMMSGRHSTQLGSQPLRNDRSALLPAMLKRQGYATAILGKWHLAGYPKDFTKAPMHPLECGFDYHFGTPGSNDAPGPPKQTLDAFNTATSDTWKIPLIRGRDVVENPADQSLFTQRYTKEAIQWIEDHKEDTFFLYLAHNMPHVPIFASHDFQAKSDAGVYGDVVEEIDWSVGEVMKAVKSAGVEEDTLIIFTSDNGPWTVFGPRHAGTAKPLRGQKGTTWEGGFRVPGIFRWPGTIEPATIDGIGVNIDFYATFATLTGERELPRNKPGWMSTDLTPTLLEGEPSPRTTWFYSPDVYRSGKFKIHRTTRQPTNPHTRERTPIARHDPPLLYNLDEDIRELDNIAGGHPEVVSRLLKELEAAQ